MSSRDTGTGRCISKEENHENVPVVKDVPISCITLVPYEAYGFFVALESAKGQGIILPGGHWEKGETFHAAASRELKEETGIQIDSGSLVYLWSGMSGDGSFTYAFLAPPLREKATAYESKEGKILVADWRDLFRSSFGAYYMTYIVGQYLQT